MPFDFSAAGRSRPLTTPPGPAPAGMRWVWLATAQQWQLDVA